MARLWTDGFDSSVAAPGTGWAVFNATGAYDTALERSGPNCLKVTLTANGNCEVFNNSLGGASLGVTRFARAYLLFTKFPTATTDVMCWNSAGFTGGIRVTPVGVTQLWGEQGTIAQVGSNGPTIPLNAWVCFEVAIQLNAGATDYLEGRIDGVSFASSSTLALTDTASEANNIGFGGMGAAGTSGDTVYVDDVAVNDSTSVKNNSWPGLTSFAAARELPRGLGPGVSRTFAARFFPSPAVAATAVAEQDPAFPAYLAIPRQRTKPIPLRRGHLFDPGWGTAYGPNPAFPPQNLRARVKASRLARGRSFEPGWPQAGVVPNPPYPPQNLRSRVKPALARRGRRAEPPLTQAAPPQALRVRVKAAALRRARRAEPLFAQDGPQPSADRVRLRAVTARRGRRFETQRTQATAGTPAYPLQSLRSRVRTALQRRRRLIPFPWPQGTQTPDTGPYKAAGVDGGPTAAATDGAVATITETHTETTSTGTTGGAASSGASSSRYTSTGREGP